MPLLRNDTDIVFLVDTSGSMQRYITRVKNALTSFAEDLNNESVSFRLGLVDFGYDNNSSGNQYINDHGFFEDVESFENALSALSSNGDQEYGLTAIHTALNMGFRPTATKRFIMLTDEGYQENNNASRASNYIQSETALAEMNNAGVVLDVVGRMNNSIGGCQYEYEPLANATGTAPANGKFYNIDDMDYTSTLREIVEDIVEQNTGGGIAIDLSTVADGQTGMFTLFKQTGENGTTGTLSSNATFLINYNGHYYGILEGVADTWEAAQAYCQSIGGNLATINDEAENTALFNYMKNYGYNNAFFGLSDAAEEGNWTWANGESLSYTNWAPGEPNGGAAENYGMFFDGVADYQWNDSAFTAGSAFLCEWNSAEEISANDNVIIAGNVTADKVYVAENSPVSTDGALIYNGHTYLIYSNADSWEAAQAYCQSLGGNLAMITDEAENTAVFDYMKSSGYDNAFFGLSDSAEEGNWTWADGTAVVYDNWAQNEPNGGTAENYAMFFAGVPDYQWNDSAFTAGSAFICEWDTEDVAAQYRQSIVIPANWNVTGTDQNDTLRIVGDNATVAGGAGADNFSIAGGVNTATLADLSIADDAMTFANSVPKYAFEYSTDTALSLFADPEIINPENIPTLNFTNITELVDEFRAFEVNNSGNTNTISELLKESSPMPPRRETNSDASMHMSFSHWTYGFEPASTSTTE